MVIGQGSSGSCSQCAPSLPYPTRPGQCHVPTCRRSFIPSTPHLYRSRASSSYLTANLVDAPQITLPHRLNCITFHRSMNTSSRPWMGAPRSSNAGPSRSVLQKLLEEINGAEPTVVTGTKTPPQIFPSRRSSVAPRSESAWVARSSVAQDARDRLRMLDEARQSRNVSTASTDSMPLPIRSFTLPTRRQSASNGVPRDSFVETEWKPLKPVFSDVDFSFRDLPSSVLACSQHLADTSRMFLA
jgi:hypothetical protein